MKLLAILAIAMLAIVLCSAEWHPRASREQLTGCHEGKCRKYCGKGLLQFKWCYTTKTSCSADSDCNAKKDACLPDACAEFTHS